MSTDFNTNTIQTEGSIRPKSIDTPLDIRTRVETEKDILSIPSPYIGMVVYVKDTGKRFEVLTLKDKKQGFSVIKNAAVGTYREIISKFDVVNTIEERNIYSEKGYASPGMSIYVLDNQKEYRYINDTWIEIINDLSQIHGHDNKDVLDSITLSDIENWNAKSNFSGSYNDLTDKPEIPSIEGLATQEFVETRIQEAAKPNFDFRIHMMPQNTKPYVITTGVYPDFVVEFHIPSNNIAVEYEIATEEETASMYESGIQ